MDKIKCDSCGMELTNDKGQTTIGISISLTDNTNTNLEVRRVKDNFGKLKFNICYCCWLKSLGVKPKND